MEESDLSTDEDQLALIDLLRESATLELSMDGLDMSAEVGLFLLAKSWHPIEAKRRVQSATKTMIPLVDLRVLFRAHEIGDRAIENVYRLIN